MEDLKLRLSINPFDLYLYHTISQVQFSTGDVDHTVIILDTTVTN